MKNKISVLFLMVILTALLSSCATMGPKVTQEELKQKQEEFNAKFYEASKNWLPRIYGVGYQLITHHVPDNGPDEPKHGFVGVGVDELKDYSRKAHNIPDSVKGVLVLGLYPGSKAEGLDLKRGDVIQLLNGEKISNLFFYFERIEKSKGDVLKVKIWRSGNVFDREIPIEHVYYKAKFFLAPTPNLDAQSLFSRIDVGIGAIRYCRNEDELAMIMGHELAHTTLNHSVKKIGSTIGSAVTYGAMAGVIDYFTLPGIGSIVTRPMQQASDNAVSREYENEADYMGVKHAFYAGYDVKHGVKAFNRLAVDAPGFNILTFIGSSHPNWPERTLRLEKTLEELKSQQPEKYERQSEQPDWDIVVPVQPGETMELALEKIIQEKHLKIELDAERERKKEITAIDEIFWKTFEQNPAPVKHQAAYELTQTWDELRLPSYTPNQFQILEVKPQSLWAPEKQSATAVSSQPEVPAIVVPVTGKR